MFRASRGKVLTRFHEQDFTIKDFDGNTKTKTVYVLVYQEGGYMRDKIMRVCNTFQGKIFTLPEDGQGGPGPFRRMIRELKDKVTTIHNLIELTGNQMKEYLSGSQRFMADDYPEMSQAMFYLQFVRREKAIFHCLNMLTRQGTIVHGYVWTPLNRDQFLERFYGPEVSLIAD